MRRPVVRMSTGRTTDDRDMDFQRHRELLRRLERIEEKIDILDQRSRAQTEAQRFSHPLPRPIWMKE